MYLDCEDVRIDWIGDGRCQDNNPYNTKDCGYDNGINCVKIDATKYPHYDE